MEPHTTMQEATATMYSTWEAQHRAAIAAADRTIARCTERMASCPPRSRWAYASQISKARNKRAQAVRALEGR